VNGPVRLAPLASRGRLYVAGDDGYVYCLNVESGALHWKTRVAPSEARTFANGRVTSAWPVRGGLTLHGGKLYCAAGLFPSEGVYVAALDAATGRKIHAKRVNHAASGQSLVVGDVLWIPEHRIAPISYDLDDCAPQEMKSIPVVRAAGGSRTWRIDQRPAFGPTESGLVNIRLSDQTSYEGKIHHAGDRDYVLPAGTFTTFAARRAVANGRAFVLVRHDEIRALRIIDFRKILDKRLEQIHAKGNTGFRKYGLPIGLGSCDKALARMLIDHSAWVRETGPDEAWLSLIATENAFIFGGRDQVLALDCLTGRKLWSAAADGDVYGLAWAGGKLYASTTKGVVHCFAPGAGGSATAVAPASDTPDEIPNRLAEFVEQTQARLGRSKGYCLLLGAELADEAQALARKTDLSIVVLETDPDKADRLRKQFRRRRLLGRNLFVRTESLAPDYPMGCANLLMVAPDSGFDPGSYLPNVQPYGGLLLTRGELSPKQRQDHQLSRAGKINQWDCYTRGVPEGFGEWSSSTGPGGNTMCTGEEQVTHGPFRIQWFGEPYASQSTDRHYVPQTPLFKDGILYYFASQHRLMGIDAYNGTRLWTIENVPTRYMASHNPSPACCGDNKQIFGASGSVCWQVDGRTGRKIRTWHGPLEGYDWGYVAAAGDLLIGSSQGRVVGSVAAHERTREAKGVSQVKTNFSSMPAVSKDLFAYDVATGQRVWTYDRGVVVSNSICLGDGKLFFLESTNQAARQDKRGLIQLSEFLARDATGHARIVALDIKTGKEVWSRQFVSPLQRDWLVYLTWARDRLLMTHTGYPPDSDQKTYRYLALSDADGKELWQNTIRSTSNRIRAGLSFAKNTISARPIVVDETFYLFATLPGADGGKTATPYSLITGKQSGTTVDAGTNDKGCSTALASHYAFYYRDWHHAALPLDGKDNYKLTGVTRPSCWPNTLPVGGLILAPEGAAACSCGFQYQLSFALAPVKKTE
jgi:outer membrane protein assembly factor BamB